VGSDVPRIRRSWPPWVVGPAARVPSARLFVHPEGNAGPPAPAESAAQHRCVLGGSHAVVYVGQARPGLLAQVRDGVGVYNAEIVMSPATSSGRCATTRPGNESDPGGAQGCPQL